MWKTKTFPFGRRGIDAARKLCDAWVQANQHRYLIEEIFVNNAFGVWYKPLLK